MNRAQPPEHPPGELLSAYLDRELPQQEAQAVHLHLSRCETCRAEYEKLEKLQTATTGLTFSEPPPEVMDGYWSGFSGRLSRRSGWLLFLTGAVLSIGYGLYQFFTDPGVEAFEKFLVFSVLTGLGLLLVSVGLDRWETLKTDRYRRIVR